MNTKLQSQNLYNTNYYYYNTKQMDSHTLSNWVKIKETFEKSGNTDNHFYKRACAIIKTGKDPLEKFLNNSSNNHHI